ncbi:PhoH family protein [Oenococcus sicerae]|uniref:PhoH-like protein n=1 Tax=Oenococcus sicerae TaxID=2203724 RepID=A0AAJ1R8I5_9LACO|nr:PhoH family protein [Oenococcus sicerae]MDN6899732.1 PhoH family protein [Oenococcus sicerae]QAS70422.1 PhoH family protein [Oenococcus sicerae]
MSQKISREFSLDSPEQLQNVIGNQDKYLAILEQGLSVDISQRGNSIIVDGEESKVNAAALVLLELIKLIKKHILLSSSDVANAISMQKKGTLAYFSELYSESLINDARNRPVRVKNFGQRQYVESIKKNEITFGIGPAGTGKTFLAVVMAISAFKKGDVDRIVITRPAVEAGESLGFLPGDLKEKVDPYLRPIYDAMDAIVGSEQAGRLIEREIVEVAPLAYMRGRTLDNAFIILDEAQNTTPAQMKMFLTRLGFNSRMLVNGDISQIDLPHGSKQSGLIQARRILQGVKSIGMVEFTHDDVVRHPLVGLIVDAYERDEKKREAEEHA